MNQLLKPSLLSTNEKFLSHSTSKENDFSGKIKISRTKGLIVTLSILVISSAFVGCNKKKDSTQEKELEKLRYAVPSFNNIKSATGLGYNKEVTGYRTQMGFHYLNEGLLDDKFEIDKPELVLFAPYGGDSLKFVAVEYATPIKDINNPPPVPEGFTGKDDVWEINTEFNLWTLHVWVGLDNPHGIFSPHNPRLP